MQPQTFNPPTGEGGPEPAHIIVAEASTNWWPGEGGPDSMRLVSQRFEELVRVNNERGYRLVDWKMRTILIPAQVDPPVKMHVNETIVAVFEKF